ncbi:MAG: 8-amino-7-oxononanoate synthase [Zetaproteobacteria bacterium]|nr:MAG: 8-amino-7-oxononanoate synthase [Zetaproteobacteria bacterium]
MPDSRNWFAPTPDALRRAFAASRRDGSWLVWRQRRLLNFASNDYLGLAVCKGVRRAAAEAILTHGLGSGASRLVSGDDLAFHHLERALAEWKGYEDCLLVGSGMLANIGLLSCLADRHCRIYADRLNHASLLDGARLSGARLRRYAHRDLHMLAKQLAHDPPGRRIIVSDGVFSMDGDCADIRGLIRLAEQYDALLLIDDAHGIGTLPDPRGLTAMQRQAGHPRLIEVGTFGKAFGGYGAFILGTHALIEGLRQRLRTMIYSTALPPALADAMIEALRRVRKGVRTRHLQRNIARFRALAHDLPLAPSSTAIQPLMVGDNERALRIASKLRASGFYVPAIRPPTVPSGTARLRITLSALHTPAQIEALAARLKIILQA